MNVLGQNNIWNRWKTVYSKLLSTCRFGIENLKKESPMVIQSSGITVATVENYNPLILVSIVIKAGSVYENAHNLGITHCLRNCSVLSTKNQSRFAVTRHLEQLGSKLHVTSTREYFIYTLQSIRSNVEPGLKLLADVIINRTFKPWEVSSCNSQMLLDLALLQMKPEAILMEDLHKVAFKGGLNNSIYSPPFMIGKHTTEMLHTFVNEYFFPAKTCIVGLGVTHDDVEWLRSISDFWKLNNTSSSQIIGQFSGGEIRTEADFPFTHIIIASEGSSMLNYEDYLKLSILQNIIDLESHTKHGGCRFSKIGEMAAKCTSAPFALSCLNISYTNTGIFGVYISGKPDDMKNLVTSVMFQIQHALNYITNAEVEAGKRKLKAKLRLERETLKDHLFALAFETSYFGLVKDFHSMDKSIDEIKTSDIISVASKVLKSKRAMAAIGRLHATPLLDELY